MVSLIKGLGDLLGGVAAGVKTSGKSVIRENAPTPQAQPVQASAPAPDMKGRSIGAYIANNSPPPEGQEASRVVEPAARGSAIVYANGRATRNMPLSDGLSSQLSQAVTNVYGEGYTAHVYSGGQPSAGNGKRVGSTRHDHGKAADVYIVGPDGKRVTGERLAQLGQYWLANKHGGVGMEMKGGGIHLDGHTDRYTHWNYGNQGGTYTPEMNARIQAGLKGELPAGVAGADGMNAALSHVQGGGSQAGLSSALDQVARVPGMNQPVGASAPGSSAPSASAAAPATASAEQPAKPKGRGILQNIGEALTTMGSSTGNGSTGAGAGLSPVMSDVTPIQATTPGAPSFVSIEPWSALRDAMNGGTGNG